MEPIVAMCFIGFPRMWSPQYFTPALNVVAGLVLAVWVPILIAITISSIRYNKTHNWSD